MSAARLGVISFISDEMKSPFACFAHFDPISSLIHHFPALQVTTLFLAVYAVVPSHATRIVGLFLGDQHRTDMGRVLRYSDCKEHAHVGFSNSEAEKIRLFELNPNGKTAHRSRARLV